MKNVYFAQLWRSLLVYMSIAVSASAAETVVWQENFDDGNSDARWFAENGVWGIGSPTTGPNPHSAPICATSGLSGNYLALQDSRLIRIATFTVPASNQAPRLRFWHWFSFAGPYYLGAGQYDEGSYGYVEIKAGIGPWQQVSPTYRGTGSAVWTRPTIDLTAFAGRSVQVAFHFHSARYTDLGWSVDDVAVVTNTPALTNPEGFESGLGDWYTESGTWEIGVPAVGPPTNALGHRAFGGTNCAATVLSASYADHVDSRLISPAFTVPAVSWPRLRFWHWFHLAGSYYLGAGQYDEGTYGYVEIRVGTNAWQQISPYYRGTSSDVWTEPSIDLRQYAGQSAQIAFHFHSAQYNAPGWYVDDVSIVTNALVLSSSETFESGLGDWYTEAGTWEIGVPTSGPPTNSLARRAFSGTNCAATVLAGSYADHVDSRLISPPFTVSSSASTRLRFWHWFEFAGSYYLGAGQYDEGSYGYVEVRMGTNSWHQVSPKYVNTSSGVWTQPSIDLTPYSGQTVQIAFHFHSAQYNAEGWYVDDVNIVTNALTLNNPEDFELGLGDWFAESGTWEVGIPTIGPQTNALGRRAFSGTNCAATVLSASYASHVDSRLVSPAFLVPPRAANPALRFRHWFSFAGAYYLGAGQYDEGSYGYVEIRVGTNAWQIISPQYGGESGTWTQPFISLARFGGQTVQVAFHFHSAQNNAAGWYVDDVRLVHDFALVLVDPPTIRTQQTACISLGIGAASTVTDINFVLEVPPGNVDNLSLNAVECWSGTVVPQSGSRWLLTLHNGCTNLSMGVKRIGSLCFRAVSPDSAFVPFQLSDLVVPNQSSTALGDQAIVVANKALLRAWVDGNGVRMLTTYGKPDTAYEIQGSTNLAASDWTAAWTNAVDGTLSTNSAVLGPISDAPNLFLRAVER